MCMAPDTVRSVDVGAAHRRRLILCLLLSLSLVALDSTGVATTLPQLARELGGGIDVAWVFASYLLAQTVITPLACPVGRYLWSTDGSDFWPDPIRNRIARGGFCAQHGAPRRVPRRAGGRRGGIGHHR